MIPNAKMSSLFVLYVNPRQLLIMFIKWRNYNNSGYIGNVTDYIYVSHKLNSIYNLKLLNIYSIFIKKPHSLNLISHREARWDRLTVATALNALKPSIYVKEQNIEISRPKTKPNQLRRSSCKTDLDFESYSLNTAFKTGNQNYLERFRSFVVVKLERLWGRTDLMAICLQASSAITLEWESSITRGAPQDKAQVAGTHRDLSFHRFLQPYWVRGWVFFLVTSMPRASFCLVHSADCLYFFLPLQVGCWFELYR